jgi:hypothetical protein
MAQQQKHMLQTVGIQTSCFTAGAVIFLYLLYG